MQILPLNKSTFPSINLVYNADETVFFRKDNFENEQNLDVLFYNFLNNARDEASNNYSTFFLTDREKLSQYIDVISLENPETDIFTTWLASDADRQLNTKTDFWVVEDIEGNQTTVDVAASGVFTEIDNRYIFDIYLLNNDICRVGHTYGGYTRYLTINYLNATANSFFCLDNGQNPYDHNSTQTFRYLYDRKNDFIVFYKLINDITYILYTRESDKDLTLVIPQTAEDFAFTNDQIYRCRKRFDPINNPELDSSWVLYAKNFQNNSLLIDDKPSPVDGYCFSFVGIKNNLLAHTEYYNLSNNSLPINLLTLKNTNTPENYQSRNNPFHVREDEILMRQYRKIFSGKSQLKGNNNVALGYENFTSQRIFEPDKLTYFHAPQNLFPFEQLNVRDTGLIDSGAIAGDHPLKADKLFKKRADYKYYSPFGDSSGEQNGTYLCTWLSAGAPQDIRPVWIDRYYYPEKTNFFSALTAPVNPFIEYETAAECLKQNFLYLNQVIVDIPSQLLFEKGVLYAYHHIGKSTISSLISSLNLFLYEKNLSSFKNTIYDTVTAKEVPKESLEYSFDGLNYGNTSRVSFPENFNEFTLCFYMNVDDWKRQFANQFIGNFVNDGFGVYNCNWVTPFLYFNAPSAIHTYNTDLELVDITTFNSDVVNIIKFDPTEDYFAILKNGKVIRKNTNDISLNENTFPQIQNTTNLYNIANNLVITMTGVPVIDPPLEDDYYILNTDTNKLTAASAIPVSAFQRRYIDFTSTGYQSIVQANNVIFQIQGKSARVLNNDIYFCGTVAPYTNILFKYDTRRARLLSAYSFTNLIDINIDYDEYVWAVHGNDGNKLSKIDLNREIVFTKSYELSGFKFERIDLLSYFDKGDHVKEMLLISRHSTNNSFRLDKINYDGEITKTKILPSILSATFADTTGGDYARYYVKKQYPENTISAKLKLRNVYDYTDIERIETKFNLSAFDTGYHHFAFRVDTYKGIFTMFVDGVEVDSKRFAQNNFIFNNLLKEPFIAGANPFFNNEALFRKLNKKDAFIYKDIKLKNIYLYKKPLDFHDINLHVKQGCEFYNIIFDIPSGRRNFIEEIEYTFKNKIPGFKTGIFDLEIKNSGINDPELRLILEKNIKQVINKVLPAHTRMRSIIWSNYNEESN
jgi:hypothetical protein